MSVLADDGIHVAVPTGWDGQIRAAGGPVAGAAAASRAMAAADADLDAPAGVGSVLHVGSFPLPVQRGDYGSGAVEVMGGSDVLVCLLEHPPEDAGTELFRNVGVPRLRHDGFSPQTMQRALPGMSGTQHFFQVAGRPFCLYVVVGSHRTRGPLVKVADDVVRSIRVDPR